MGIGKSKKFPLPLTPKPKKEKNWAALVAY